MKFSFFLGLMIGLCTCGVLVARENDGTARGLMGKLGSGDLAERTGAVVALLELGGEAKEAFPALAEILAEDEALDTAIASRTLYARVRPRTDVASLVAAPELDTKARVAAAWELSRAGLAAGPKAAPALIEALRHPDKHERNLVVVALATTATPLREVVLALLKILKDEGSDRSQQTNYKFPRASAAVALGVMGPEASEATDALIELLGEKGTWDIQRAANCFALGQIYPTAPTTIAALKLELNDNSPLVRGHAARAIESISASKGIAGTAPTGDIGALVRTLTDEPSRVNLRVVEVLRALGEFAAEAKPVAKLGSRRGAPVVHESISLAIGYLDSLTQPPSPGEIARQEKAGALGPEARQYIMALGGIQQGIAPVLLAALAEGERDRRVRAIRRLATIGPAAEKAAPALRIALADADWLVRREAYFALQHIDQSMNGAEFP